MRRLSRGAIAAGLVWMAGAGAASAAPALWEVRDKDSVVYLFGSMHVLRPDVRWRTRAFDRAYAAAGRVWFETRADLPPDQVKGLVDRYGVDPDRSLTQKLSPTGLATLRPVLDRDGVPLERVERLRPWAAAMMLSVAPMAREGGEVASGVDAATTRRARTAEKPIETFETFEQQLRIFADLPEQAELDYLDDVAREQLSPPRDGVALERAWLKGDTGRLGARLADRMRTDRPALYDALLRRRNLAWADRLDAEMRQGKGTDLVIVGALHMAGDEGLPALMKARGYAVRRIQ
ncbi:TraB/GumN family protein [Caulobacter sp. RL271]|uniref:TraB/GumN family protein n=1 Tax=Caulobacter segnis TaxID=88688 RepID=A0ABY4ZNG3_9CAUL|nr:TraB/GumN family protein [Caulobacter segnis]USQ94342.1 TraB/GumN family protein [Caulobacter segnis]